MFGNLDLDGVQNIGKLFIKQNINEGTNNGCGLSNVECSSDGAVGMETRLLTDTTSGNHPNITIMNEIHPGCCQRVLVWRRLHLRERVGSMHANMCLRIDRSDRSIGSIRIDTGGSWFGTAFDLGLREHVGNRIVPQGSPVGADSRSGNRRRTQGGICTGVIRQALGRGQARLRATV